MIHEVNLTFLALVFSLSALPKYKAIHNSEDIS